MLTDIKYFLIGFAPAGLTVLGLFILFGIGTYWKNTVLFAGTSFEIRVAEAVLAAAVLLVVVMHRYIFGGSSGSPVSSTEDETRK